LIPSAAKITIIDIGTCVDLKDGRWPEAWHLMSTIVC